MIEILKEMDEDIKVVERLNYYSKDENYYLEEFNKLKDKNIINKSIEFEDDIWVVTTGQFSNRIVFSLTEFNYINSTKKSPINLSYMEVKKGIKYYVILMLNIIVGKTCATIVNAINKIIIHTNGFSEEYLEKIDEDNFFKKTAYIWVLQRVLEYIDYMMFDINDIYIEKFEEILDKNSINKKFKKNRSLPDFKTMFILEDYINHFIKTCNDYDFEKFFPIIFWWKLSTIIPIRTKELLLTLNNGLKYKNNRYTLTISRTALKGNKRYRMIDSGNFEDCYYTQEIAITEELALIIKRYQKMLGNIDKDRKFLISKETVKKFAKHRGGFSNELNKDIYTYFNFRFNLILFQEEILKGRYNLTFKKDITDNDSYENPIDNIRAMDTRHFAIINMVLMGYEPNTIAELSGHEDVESSYHYYSHIEEFANCYIISTAKNKAFNTANNYSGLLNIESDIVNNKTISNRLKKLYLMENKYKEVDGGYCIYTKDDLEPCISVDGNHKRCGYFIPSIDKGETLTEELLKIDGEISSEIKTLKNLVKNHKTIIGFSDKYAMALKKIISSADNKSEILKNYILSEI